MLRLATVALALCVSADARRGSCRGNKGWYGGYGHGPPHGPPHGYGQRPPPGQGPPRGDVPPEEPKPTPLLNSTAAVAAKPLLDARAEKLWGAFKHTAAEKHMAAWTRGTHNATSKLALAFRVVTQAAEGAAGDDASAAKVAVSVWEALPVSDREKHDETWATHKGDGVLQLAYALAVMRTPGVNTDAAQEKAWITAEELKGIYEADVEAATEAWKDEGEEAPDTDEATRLLLGCMAVASNIQECNVQAEWARKCHECEQEHKMRHHGDDPLNGHPAWLVAAIGVSAALVLGTAVAVGCLVRSKMKKAAARKMNADAPVWPESKLEAMKVAEKQAKLECVEGVQVDSKVDPEVGFAA